MNHKSRDFFLILSIAISFIQSNLESECTPIESKLQPTSNVNLDDSMMSSISIDSNTALYERLSTKNTIGGLSKIYTGSKINVGLAEKQIYMHKKLRSFTDRAAPDFLNCEIEVQKESQSPFPSKIFLHFQNFYDFSSQPKIVENFTRSNFFGRLKFYASAARALSHIHSRDIAHCNISLRNFGSLNSGLTSAAFKDFSSAVDLSKEDFASCSAPSEFPYASDLSDKECQTKEMVNKADIWALAMVFLQLESGQCAYGSTFFWHSNYFQSLNCYEKWSNDCGDFLNELTESTFQIISKENKRSLKEVYAFKEILKKMLKNCKERISASFLWKELEVIANPTQKKFDIEEQEKDDDNWFFRNLFCCGKRDKKEKLII